MVENGGTLVLSFSTQPTHTPLKVIHSQHHSQHHTVNITSILGTINMWSNGSHVLRRTCNYHVVHYELFIEVQSGNGKHYPK